MILTGNSLATLRAIAISVTNGLSGIDKQFIRASIRFLLFGGFPRRLPAKKSSSILNEIYAVNTLSTMTVPYVSVNVTALLHLSFTVGTLEFRHLTALEFSVSYQTPQVHVCLRATRTAMPLLDGIPREDCLHSSVHRHTTVHIGRGPAVRQTIGKSDDIVVHVIGAKTSLVLELNELNAICNRRTNHR